MRPDLSKIKWIKPEVLSLFVCHYLDFKRPLWKIFIFDCIDKISLCMIGINSPHLFCIWSCKVFYTLYSFEVKLNPDFFVFLVDYRIGMASISVHIAI